MLNRDSSDKMGELVLTKIGKSDRLTVLTFNSRRLTSCPAPVRINPIRPKRLFVPTLCPPPSSQSRRAPEKNVPVPTANAPPPGIIFAIDHFIISAILTPDGPSILCCNIPFIIVASVTNTSTLIAQTLLRPNPITPMPSLNSPFVSSSMTDCPTGKPVGISGEITEFSFPTPPSKTGLRRRGKKTYSKIESDDYLDWAFENFSGYIAVDEVYDGPFCILSVVDNGESKRLTFRVLDHAPTAADILELFQSFQQILKRRELILYGITTDGSSLYTEPVRAVFPGISHQICEFHVKKEINKAILKAVAQVCRAFDKTKVKRSRRGRPATPEEKATVRRNERIDAKIGALFEHRYLFVQKTLTKKERETLHEITKGLPELRQLREIVDETYRLYDRRCCRATALKKLRDRVKRFKRLSKVLLKWESPTMDRSLVFLDDKNLPSTSNAVERSNRRFRKMQKTVYRVRTYGHVRNRTALDMFRDSRLPSRRRTLQLLHNVRDG